MDERGKQLRVPLYALEDFDDGKNVEIGDFGYDDETKGSSESTDAMFDDNGEFADVAGSVTELTNRGYKLARRVVSMGGSVRDILEGLNSLYIRPPDIRSANPTVGSYAFSNIMVLLESKGLIKTERGMPVEIVFRPLKSKKVFRTANPDDPTMAGLGKLRENGISVILQSGKSVGLDTKMVKSALGAGQEAAYAAAFKRAGETARAIGLAASGLAGGLGADLSKFDRAEVKRWAQEANIAMWEVESSDPIIWTDNLLKLTLNAWREEGKPPVTYGGEPPKEPSVAATDAFFDGVSDTFQQVGERVVDIVTGAGESIAGAGKRFAWIVKYAPYILLGVGSLFVLPHVLNFTRMARRARSTIV